jgi:Carboxypeptidase regulatory-like domain
MGCQMQLTRTTTFWTPPGKMPGDMIAVKIFRAQETAVRRLTGVSFMSSPQSERYCNRQEGRQHRLTGALAPNLLIAGLWVLLPALLSAQTAKLQGRVTDSSGAIIPGAQVSVTNSQSGVKLSSQTNDQGEYSLPFLQPGDYNISIGRQGFETFQRPNVHLDLDQTAAIDVTLPPGEVNETVEVKGASPLLQTQTTSVDQTIDNRTVITLPLNGRDYTQLVTLAAGAAPNNRSRTSNGFSLNGSQTFQNTMLLNGVDNNNYLLGADSANMNAVTPSIDAIQEFQVETSNYSAQYGRSAGAW